MLTPLTSRSVFVVLVAAAALGLSACGSDTNAQIKSLQTQGEKLQQQGQQVAADAKKLSEQVKAGTITQAQATKKLKAELATVSANAKKTANNAVNAVKNNSAVPDSAKQALAKAQAQLKSTP